MKIAWSPIALERIDEIIEYVSLDSKSMAKRAATSIFETVGRLRKFPNSGRIVPEAKRPDIREIIKMNFRIIYRIERGWVLILTVRHSRRKFSMGEIARARDTIIPDDPMRGLTMQ